MLTKGLLNCHRSELNLNVVLLNGQSFRWKIDEADNSFVGVALHRMWRLKRISDQQISFVVLARFSKAIDDDDEQALRSYFQLESCIDLNQLYADWSRKDGHFRTLIEKHGDILTGIRILLQDPFECFFSFICSSNNHITRISKMVELLCETYGEKTDSNENDSKFVYDFPSLPSLCQFGVEQKLRQLGFGYRAGYLAKSAIKMSENGGEKWLQSLAEDSYEDVKMKLVQFPGVGPKVADCICLMSLNKSHVVPIDVHIWKITTKEYLPHLGHATNMTPRIYREIGDFYRQRFGLFAGWAHSVLFSADLRHFTRNGHHLGDVVAKKGRTRESRKLKWHPEVGTLIENH